MAVVSYRFYCEKCDNEEVIPRSEMDDSPWKIISAPFNQGLCPSCNNIVNLDDLENGEQYAENLVLEELDNIGAKAAENLREGGYDNSKAIADASDDELLEIGWVGEKALFSLKEAAKELEPQKRWDNEAS